MIDKKSEALKQLAETLIKSGLATSESLAIEKAREMLDIQERTKTKLSMETEKEGDIEKEERTVDELMQEAGVGAGEEQPEEQNEGTIEEPEEASEEEKEIAEEENAEEEGEEITIREQTKEPEEEKELKKPTYDEEKKIDLSEMFNYGKRNQKIYKQ